MYHTGETNEKQYFFFFPGDCVNVNKANLQVSTDCTKQKQYKDNYFKDIYFQRRFRANPMICMLLFQLHF